MTGRKRSRDESRRDKPRRALATTVESGGRVVLVSVWDSFRDAAVSVRAEDVRQLRRELDAIIWENDL